MANLPMPSPKPFVNTGDASLTRSLTTPSPNRNSASQRASQISDDVVSLLPPLGSMNINGKLHGSCGYSFRHTTKRTCCIVPTSLGDVAGSTSPNGSTPTLPPLSSTSQPSSNDTNRPHRRVMLPPIGTITCYFSLFL